MDVGVEEGAHHIVQFAKRQRRGTDDHAAHTMSANDGDGVDRRTEVGNREIPLPGFLGPADDADDRVAQLRLVDEEALELVGLVAGPDDDDGPGEAAVAAGSTQGRAVEGPTGDDEHEGEHHPDHDGADAHLGGLVSAGDEPGPDTSGPAGPHEAGGLDGSHRALAGAVELVGEDHGDGDEDDHREEAEARAGPHGDERARQAAHIHDDPSDGHGGDVAGDEGPAKPSTAFGRLGRRVEQRWLRKVEGCRPVIRGCGAHWSLVIMFRFRVRHGVRASMIAVLIRPAKDDPPPVSRTLNVVSTAEWQFCVN